MKKTLCLALLLAAGCDDTPKTMPDTGTSASVPPTLFAPPSASQGQGEGPSKHWIDPGADEKKAATRAIAVLHGLGDVEATGTVSFEEKDGKVHIETKLDGLPAGKHGYHVHLLGDCSSADGKSAGTHFNFEGSSKSPPKDIDRITGNLGVLEAGDDGKATHEADLERASLQGDFSIIGRAVIVHEKPNDPKSPPIGAAGGRIACGVIGLAE